MGLQAVVSLIHDLNEDNWKARNLEAYSSLFGTDGGRYDSRNEKSFALRAPEIDPETGVRYAAYIHNDNPPQGRYGGFSFVIFPVQGHPALIGLGVGTGGLSPDEPILGRPGHARKARAISEWLNSTYGHGEQIAWAKEDPTRTDITIPDQLRDRWSEYENVFRRYGREMYLLFRPTDDQQVTERAVAALLDLSLRERNGKVLTRFRQQADEIRDSWMAFLFPALEAKSVAALLRERRYAVIQGPPGTGKTRLALQLIQSEYEGAGTSIQFHPNTTYESFVGGMAPTKTSSSIGLSFEPVPGSLMKAIQEARKISPKPFLLHIDEINRADLSKVLGEAIFLFEPGSDTSRVVNLPYDFGTPWGNTLSMPDNLHVLGTMNSADRSIALLDIAVRRRFAFTSLWPSTSVVKQHGGQLMQEAFQEMVSIFVEHAPEGAFNLIPGHSYFLQINDGSARQSLRVNLIPLLEEYLSQGLVASFSEPIRGYLQWLRSI